MTVSMANHKFVIHGKETFLYGGELHYFRVPKSAWEDRLQKLLEASCNLVSTYVPWIWHEPEEGRIDMDGETHERRDLGGFLALVRQMGLYCIVRPGPYVMAEIRYHGVPEWLIKRYPEVVARTQDGGHHPAQVVAYRHPVFLDKVTAWYEAVNQVIAPMQTTHGGPVIMYQLCNEIGMLQWVTHTMDYAEDTLQKFAAYLQQTYGTIGAFRAKYGVSDASFASFARRFANGLRPSDPSFHFTWGYFWRSYIKDYVDDLRNIAMHTGIEVPFIINIHGFKTVSGCSRGTDYPLGLSQLCQTAECRDVVLAGDFYPGHVGYDTYHDLVLAAAFTRAVSAPPQPVFSAEFQAGHAMDRPRLYPQDLDLSLRTCVAHGMNAVNYYMFVAGENPADLGLYGARHEWQAPVDSQGGLRPHYATARHLGLMFAAIGSGLLNAAKKAHTFIGFMPDDYMTESVADRDRPLLGELLGQREQCMFDGVARLLVAANIQFEALDLRQDIDAAAVPTLWVFSTRRMDAGLQERLVSYVRNGGKLVLYPHIPGQDWHGEPCTILQDGLRLGAWETVGVDTVDVLAIASVHIMQRLRFTRFDGEPVATFTRQGGREVAAYHKRVGQGHIVVLGIAMGHHYHYQLDFIRRLAALIGVKGHLWSTSPDLSLVERTDGVQSFIFINNYDELGQRAVIYEHETPLFGGSAVVIPPRSGAIFLRNYTVKDGVWVAYATVEFTGINAADNVIQLSVQPVGGDGKLKLQLGQGWEIRPVPWRMDEDSALCIGAPAVIRLVREEIEQRNGNEC